MPAFGYLELTGDQGIDMLPHYYFHSVSSFRHPVPGSFLVPRLVCV